MVQTSPYCKAYVAKAFRSFQGGSENRSNFRKARKTVAEKELEFDGNA